MKIAILGATGGCGLQLVEQAKARGHEVTAVVRSTSWQPPAGVRVVRGDLTNEAFLREAVRGQEAVLSALGLRMASLAPWTKPEVPDFLTRATPALVAALRAEGVKRVVAISAGGVGDSFEAMPGVFKAIIRTTALRKAYAELDVMERALLGSGLDVVICRPSGLTDGPVTGKVKIARTFKGRATISRADVAAWMLDAVVKPDMGERTPMISETGVD